MLLNEVKPGAKFEDPTLLSSPKPYRIFVVDEVQGLENFTARQVSTNTTRKYPLDADAVERLREIKPFPKLQADLDSLVGDRVRVELSDGGSIHATVTAIRYGEVVIDGAVFPFIREIELDRSFSTTYTLNQIKKLVRIRSAR